MLLSFLGLVSGWLTEGMHTGELESALVAAGLFIGWLVLLPLSKYPGNIGLELGDIPASFRVAANLVEGRGLQEDYFIGEFLGGQYHYVTRQPILAYIAAYFFRLFGPDSFIIHLYSQFAGAILLMLTASLPYQLLPANGELASLMPWLVLMLGFLPTQFLLNGLGAHTLPSGVAFLCLMPLYLGLGGWGGFALGTCCLVYMFWLRPEGQLLAMLCVVGFAIVQVPSLPLWGIIAIVSSTIIGAVGVWRFLPRIVDRLPGSFKNLIVFYLKFDATTDSFVPTYNSIGHLMGLFNDTNMHSPDALKGVTNKDLVLEIKSHPRAFFRYLLNKMMELCRVVVLTYSLPFRRVYDLVPIPLAVGFVAVLVGVGFGVENGRGLLLSCMLYCFCSAIFNELWVRHVMVVTPVLTSLFLSQMLSSLGPAVSAFASWTFGSSVCVLVVTLELLWLARVRLRHENSGFNEIFMKLRPHVGPQTTVLNTYPQLFSFVLGCRSVGTTYLVDTLEHYIRRFKPEFIVVDSVRGEDVLIRRMRERFGSYVPGYFLWASSPEWGLIYKTIGAQGEVSCPEASPQGSS
jgi:hypothetical protein